MAGGGCLLEVSCEGGLSAPALVLTPRVSPSGRGLGRAGETAVPALPDLKADQCAWGPLAKEPSGEGQLG